MVQGAGGGLEQTIAHDGKWRLAIVPQVAKCDKAPLLLKGLDDTAQAAFLARAVRRAYAPNQFIYVQDDDPECLYFVAEGYIRLSYLMEDGSTVLHAVLSAGEAFGELAVFDNGQHCDTATAIGPVVVLAVPIAAFRALAESNPSITRALAKLVAKRYRAYVELTRTLSLKSLAGRLSQTLLRIADSVGQTATIRGRPCLAVPSVITQTDLGLMARGARGNVNRAIKQWQRLGWIALQDRSILIVDRRQLETVCLRGDL
jgi:CRP-like cAMP-binding protein